MAGKHNRDGCGMAEDRNRAGNRGSNREPAGGEYFPAVHTVGMGRGSGEGGAVVPLDLSGRGDR